MEDKMFRSHNLRKLRQDGGYSKEDIAKICNVDPKTISNWEEGKTIPNAAQIGILADFFKVLVDMFYKPINYV